MSYERMSAGLLDVKLAGPDVGTFSGYGAVFGNIDSHGDVIEPDAFDRSLKEWQGKGKWPKMLLQHGGMGVTSDDMLPIGQWTAMGVDAKGLHVTGRLFAMGTERGQYVYEGLKSGELDELSIGYHPKKAERGTRHGESVRLLKDIELMEVSIVTFASNDRAKVTGVKSLTPDELREFEGSLRDGGLSQREAVIASSVLKKWLQRDVGAPANEPRDEVSAEEAAILASLNNSADRMWSEVFRRR
jgi:HK97 family phage prohead protease